jgi:hypothetical protein
MVKKKIMAILLLVGIMLISLCMALPAKAQGVTFTVTDESTGSHVSGNAGDTLSFGGTGFTTGETVDIYVISIDGNPGGSDPAITVDDIDNSGNFITIPDVETYGGVYVLEAVGRTSLASAQTTFTILPCIVLTPTNSPVGNLVSVEGHGFQSGIENDLSASWDGSELTAIIDDYDASTGWFTAHFNVPIAIDGAHAVTFLEAEPDPPFTVITSASATFSVGSISPLPEYPLGGLIALIACFAMFALYVKRKSLSTLKMHF